MGRILGWPRSCLFSLAMDRKLHLLRDVRRDRERAVSSSEEQYRYPAHEEVWEVSCEPEWED